MSSRSTPSSMGAVKLTAPEKPQPMRHFTKLSLGLLAVAGGILITTQSNGTTDASKTAMMVLPTQTASPTTFFFNDRDNALGDQQPEQGSIIRTPVLTTVEDTLPNTTGHGTKPDFSKTADVQESTVQRTSFNPIAPESVTEPAEQKAAYEPIVEELINESSKAGSLIGRTTTASETLPGNTLLAMNTPTESSALTLQPHYKEQPQDIQAGKSDVNANNPFVEADTTPKTTTIFNHPSIETIRQKTEFPEGATTESVTVAAGDTLSKLLNDRGVKMDQMPQLLTDDVIKQYLSNLDIGQTFQVVRLANGEFHSLSAKVGDERQVSIRRSDNGFATASIDLPLEKERVVTSGTIEQSLYVAADHCTVTASTLVMEISLLHSLFAVASSMRRFDIPIQTATLATTRQTAGQRDVLFYAIPLTWYASHQSLTQSVSIRCCTRFEPTKALTMAPLPAHQSEQQLMELSGLPVANLPMEIRSY